MQTPPNQFTLASLPTPAKVLLTLFLALIGCGYLSALGNLYYQYRMADGKPDFTIDDLRVTFHGMEAAVEVEGSAGPAVAKSRMLEMVEPGGDMRKHLNKGGPQAIRALEEWLKRGATEAELTRTGLVGEGDPCAEAVIARHCLRCHNREDGEKADTPYGPDLFATDYQMVYQYAAPGTAHGPEADSVGGSATPRLGPHGMGHLLLITHVHMLSIPIFTLIISGLFLLTGLRPAVRGALAPIPMLMLVAEFAGWWLARTTEVLIYLIVAAGAVYGLTLALQLVTVAASVWFGRKRGFPACEGVS